MSNETKPKPKAKIQKFKYVGTPDKNRKDVTIPIWDGQHVKKGETFTPKDENCARMCAGSPYFKKV